MSEAMRQKPVQAGREDIAAVEARCKSSRDEAYDPRLQHQGTGPKRSPGGSQMLLEAALAKDNLQQAWKRVKGNKGAAGVDGLDIDQTARHLRTHWPTIRTQLLQGRYQPSPVRRVTIPKPDGGERELGIPTVTDRLIQQALLQVLQPILDASFSEHSYGFRPGRNAHGAIRQARNYVQKGKRIVVDVDLEKFFDRVNHDILINRLSRRIADDGVIRLVRAYLNSGIMVDGVVVPRQKGTPQGGPLSPLLANVLLDEVDKELERRGHSFVRYADDCNIYVGSMKAGERVMRLLRRLYDKLHLKINEAKSSVSSALGRKFLGYELWMTREGEVRFAVGAKPLAQFKRRIRHLTRRSGGRSMSEVIQSLRRYIPGWKSYFELSQTPRIWHALDEWIRRRLRLLQLKQWRRGTTTYRALRALGATDKDAKLIASHSYSWWRVSNGSITKVMTINYFTKHGLPQLS